ncbi:hypothetical protein RHRU231_230052 [Rhodococcus ruber]|uniref:Uncharacterized protein n=1 Tax=Rhodococcus ruber TaxID=1830 RepID=A0A098BES8_9NOCA|nr:hypothetical protein RHRU231_230052 [Rhodococcus ruber]
MIEQVNALGDRPLDVSNAPPASAWVHHGIANALSLEQRVQRLRHRVVDRYIPYSPTVFINRSTVHSATDILSRFRLACTLRTPYTPRLSA